MKQISVLVIDPVGLHARPATVAVNAASKFTCDVKVSFIEDVLRAQKVIA